MSHHEKKKADEPKPPAAAVPADDTEGQSWHVNQGVPTEPADTSDENSAGEDTEGHWNPARS